MADLIDFNARRAARVHASAAEPKAIPGEWLCRLDVYAPAIPGAEARADFCGFNLDGGQQAPDRLVEVADALEQIASSLRTAARADAG